MQDEPDPQTNRANLAEIDVKFSPSIMTCVKRGYQFVDDCEIELLPSSGAREDSKCPKRRRVGMLDKGEHKVPAAQKTMY